MTEPNYRYCSNCTAPRLGLICWKCASSTTQPPPQWEFPPLPPVDKIRAVAREVGYAIGEHGSKERDLDVIAVPWVEDAVDTKVFLEYLAKGIDGRVISTETKPHGRLAATIQINGYFRPLDISICPLVTPRT